MCHNKRIAIIGHFTLVGFFNRGIGCCHNKRLITMIGPFTLVRFYNSHGSLSYNIIPLYIFRCVYINKVLEGFDDNNNIWIGSRVREMVVFLWLIRLFPVTKMAFF